ncbi:hypothetical protein ACJA28_00565 [Mesomycoplasma moatsii]|uniref:hypothetical protein n=1 Tax=Mesomycoplasma moatsii TaxID=171287 RepID=UPI0003B68840
MKIGNIFLSFTPSYLKLSLNNWKKKIIKVDAIKINIVVIEIMTVHLLFSLYDFQKNQAIILTSGAIIAYSIIHLAIPDVIKVNSVSHTIENMEPIIGPNKIPLNIQNNISILKFNGPLKINEQTYLVTK